MYTNMKRTETETETPSNVILKDYEKAIIDLIVENKPEAIDSRTAYDYLIMKGYNISRASVINFLNLLRDQNLVKYSGRLGKGGMAGLYGCFMHDTARGITTRICLDLMEQMKTEFKDVNLIWCALNLQNPQSLLTREECLEVANAIRNTITDEARVKVLVDKIKDIAYLE